MADAGNGVSETRNVSNGSSVITPGVPVSPPGNGSHEFRMMNDAETTGPGSAGRLKMKNERRSGWGPVAVVPVK